MSLPCSYNENTIDLAVALSTKKKPSDPSDLSYLVRWVLTGLAIMYVGVAMTRFPPRMLVKLFGESATRAMGVALIALGFLYGYAVKVNPVTQRLLRSH